MSWYVSADNEKVTHDYLRSDFSSDPAMRRLSMIGKFSEKLFPADFERSDKLSMNGIHIMMEEC